MKSRRPMPGLLLRHEPNRPEAHGDACWDCSRALGRRTTVVCRGVHDDGKFAMFSLCSRCAKWEAYENETGRIHWGRRVNVWLRNLGRK